MSKIDKELSTVIDKLKKIEKSLDKGKIKKILKDSAKPLLLAARANVPVSEKTHFRYNTAKINRKMRAPKGKGNKIANYSPGNLKRSIQVLRFRKSRHRIYVGPKVAKRNNKGSFSGRRVDGYYAAWVEFGTRNMKGAHYMSRAFESTKGIVKADIIERSKRVIREMARKQNLN